MGVYALDWSPDGRYIVIGTDNGWLKIYDAETGKYLWGLNLGGRIVAVEWSPDGEYISVANLNGGHYLINTNLHRIAWITNKGESVCSIAWDPSGEYLAVSGWFRTALFTRNGKPLWINTYIRTDRTFYAHGSLEWNRDGLLAVGADKLYILDKKEIY